jgi:transposase
MRRHELSDEQFAQLAPLLPVPGSPGRPWAEHRRILNGLFWKLHTGAQWRDIPERDGPWKTIYDRHVRWRRDGTWDRILQALQVQLDAEGRIDWEQWCSDGTSIRASRAAAGARKKGGAT